MGKCLVTKLNGTVDNNSILKVGELRLNVQSVSNPTAQTQELNLMFAKDTTVSIIGNGYFTDSSLSQNNGKTCICKANTTTTLILSNGDYELSIPDKYSIIQINCWNAGSCVSMDISDLKYSLSINSIALRNAQVSGDISALSNLTALWNISIRTANISGDISALSNLTALATLNLQGTQVSGDISALSNLTALATLNLQGTQVSGDISALSNLTKLTSFTVANMSGDISTLSNVNATDVHINQSSLTGDLAVALPKVSFLSFYGDNGSVFSWSSRPSSCTNGGLEGYPTVQNLDKMLQDLANCQVPTSNKYTLIQAKGNRTSASDAAVQTLQSKGYTVSITPA